MRARRHNLLEKDLEKYKAKVALRDKYIAQLEKDLEVLNVKYILAMQEIVEPDLIDLDGLAVAIFEASHEPPFPDDSEGMDLARERAKFWAKTYLLDPKEKGE